MALTPKQNLFIDGLLDGKTKRQAYIDAGYATAGKSNKYIDTRASELYNNSEVLGKYTELVDRLHDRTLWTREQAIKDYIEGLAGHARKRHTTCHTASVQLDSN